MSYLFYNCEFVSFDPHQPICLPSTCPQNFFFFSKSRQILYQLSYQGSPQFYLKDQYLTMCRSLPYVTPVSKGIQAEFIGQEQKLDSSESPVLTPGSQGVDPLCTSQAHWDSRKHTIKAISPKTSF